MYLQLLRRLEDNSCYSLRKRSRIERVYFYKLIHMVPITIIFHASLYSHNITFFFCLSSFASNVIYYVLFLLYVVIVGKQASKMWTLQLALKVPSLHSEGSKGYIAIKPIRLSSQLGSSHCLSLQGWGDEESIWLDSVFRIGTQYEHAVNSNVSPIQLSYEGQLFIRYSLL